MKQSITQVASSVVCVLVFLLSHGNGLAEIAKFGSEFNITGKLPGDQIRANVSLGKSSGLLVWQDNATDEEGMGIRAARLSSSGRSPMGSFRVNSTGLGDQENPVVDVDPQGRFYIAYQSGVPGEQDIQLRILNDSGVFEGQEITVNTYRLGQQEKPAIAVLKDGNIVIAWSSQGQDGHLSGVFAQILSSTGAKLGDEFQVNSMTGLNQRDASVGALENGGFVISWVSEMPRSLVNASDPDGGLNDGTLGAARFDIVIMGQVFDQTGRSLNSNEVMLSPRGHFAHPNVIGLSNGGFLAAFSVNTGLPKSSGWDVQIAAYDSKGNRNSSVVHLNSHVFGDQLQPKLAGSDGSVFAVWTSVGQDGSFMGVFGRGVKSDGSPLGDAFLINSTRQGNQQMPAVSINDEGEGLVVWSSYDVAAQGLELFAQSILSDLENLFAPGAPIASPLSSHQIGLNWSTLEGVDLDSFLLYIDGSETPVELQGGQFIHEPVLAGSRHEYTLAYRAKDGRISPRSEVVSATSWGLDGNFDGLPDDWQRMYWPSPAKLPGPMVDSDGDGATNRDEFLSGTDPTDANSVLKTSLSAGALGWNLVWNTNPGSLYQAQVSNDLQTWINVGQARLSAGKTDSIALSVDSLTGYFRVILIR